MEFEKLDNNLSQRLSVVGGGLGGAFNTNPAQMGNQALLPEGAAMLQGLYAAYGMQFTEINMGDPKLKDKAVAVGKVAEIAKVNMTALEQMLKHTATLMAGQVKLAEFYAASTQIVVSGKKRIDRATANSFLALADYQRHTQSLASKVDRKIKALDAKYELVGQLGEGKLSTSLKLIESQKQAGEKREEVTLELQQKRQELLASVATRRQKDREYIRTGHLTAK